MPRKILIAETTREERIQIVQSALGEWGSWNCASATAALPRNPTSPTTATVPPVVAGWATRSSYSTGANWALKSSA